ncbi:flavin-containing superfamily amine oxidase [Cladorrhinum samala]|uniref:Flavin-containing superfamily amine oxidase n=1 Tax=Cladorrhinum samala TaxID=585594 RepID=A0AAV9HV89_9PEZI|nr:flavin-containing superfamily amine oxidase [Cladorrhinum samala]
MLPTKQFLSAALLLLSPSFGAATIDIGSYLSNTILVRDVAIIGGGSSGTYAAVQLKRSGYSVAVVEKAGRLGGHVDTYQDPATGAALDYGVVALLNTSVVRDYFSFFNEGLTTFTTDPSITGVYANFKKDGKIAAPPATVPWADPAAVFASLLGYGAQISQYPFLVDGYNLPNPVPEDLLLPFGEFLSKHNLGALAGTFFNLVSGVGNLLATTTLYVFKYVPKTTIDAFSGLGTPPLTSTGNGFQALYNKAFAYLGSGANVILNAKVRVIERDGPRVLVAVTTPSGPKLIIAKELLVAVQPKLSVLQEIGLDLTREERGIFGQFNNSYYWDIVIKNSGLPADLSFTNADFDAPLGIAPLPGIQNISPARVKDLTLTYYTSPSSKTDAEVKADVLATLARLRTANNFTAAGASPAAPELVGFNNHQPFWLTVPPAAIASGFYGQLNGLQGKKKTWWTGATFVAHDSSAIWAWSEASLLPKLKAAL